MMMIRKQHLAALAVCWMSWMIPSTWACGGLFCQPNQPVLQRGEGIVFAMNEATNTVTMHVQILYEGPAEDFSWVLPVPATPTLSIGTDVLFRSLFDSTLPTFQLDIAEDLSTTCSLDEVQPFLCPFLNQADDASAGAPTALVVKQGSVGPFEFVVLEAASSDPTSVFTWLEQNGYDQPDESAALLNYYAIHGHQFVALRLQKDTETGEIEPLVLTYEMPGEGILPEEEEDIIEDEMLLSPLVARRMALACVPIQLTSIAATENMPIQVYVLGEARAVPLNYLEVQLDDRQVDWVGCFNNPSCYDNDYRQRFQQVTDEISNHTFVTEYAGSTDILANAIAINLTAQELAQTTSPTDFLFALATARVPDTRRVVTLIDEYIPPVFPENAPSFCQSLTTVYQGPNNGFGIPAAQCLWNYQPTADWTWDPMGLAQALEEFVFDPAAQAQQMVMEYSYMTRMYTRLSPTNMNKDPFFAFKPELPDVTNLHRAVGIPECGTDGVAIALDITVERTANSFSVPATLGCGGWIPTEPMPLPANTTSLSTAQQVAAWGFANDEGVVVLRLDDGSFDQQTVQTAIDYGDSLVMDQTIPEYTIQVVADGNDTANDAGMTGTDGDNNVTTSDAGMSFVNTTVTNTTSNASATEEATISSGAVDKNAMDPIGPEDGIGKDLSDSKVEDGASTREVGMDESTASSRHFIALVHVVCILGFAALVLF